MPWALLCRSLLCLCNAAIPRGCLFFPVCFLPWIVFIQPKSVSSYTRGTLLKANGFSVLPPQAYNLNCTAVGQSGSNIALGTFLGRREKKNGAIRIAILLSVRTESDLLCPLQSHPLQPTGGHMEQSLQYCFSSCRTCWYTSTTLASTGSCHLPCNNPCESWLFTLPLTYVFLSVGLWISFAPWLDANCLIQWVLHGFCATSTKVQSSLLHESEELLL